MLVTITRFNFRFDNFSKFHSSSALNMTQNEHQGMLSCGVSFVIFSGVLKTIPMLFFDFAHPRVIYSRTFFLIFQVLCECFEM